MLLQDGRVDPLADNSYALLKACENDNVDVVILLLKDGRADPTEDNNYAIKAASQNGNQEVVKVLLQDGRVDPTADNDYAIRRAKTEEIREMLIAYKYRVDGKEYCKAKSDLALLDCEKNEK
jgi:ankyrin repeat protein